MAEEFTTKTTLQVEVDQASLRSARQDIEDGVSGAAVAAGQSGGGGGGGGVIDALEEGLSLDQTRNDILRDILDAQEMSARTGGGGGGLLQSLGGGAAAVGGGALGIAVIIGNAIMSVDWMGLVGDAIPDIQPGDVVDAAEVAVSEFVGEGLPATASDFVGDDLPVDVGAILAGAFPLTIGALLADAFPIKPGDIIGEPSGGPPGDGSPAGDGGDFPFGLALGGGAAAGGAYGIAQQSGVVGQVLNKLPGISGGTSGVSGLFTAEMFQGGPTDEWIQSQFGDDIPGSILTQEGRRERLQIASEAASMLFGGDTGPAATGGTRRPESSVPAGSVNPNQSFIDMARNRTGGRAPGPQLEVVTVGEDSNRNDSNRQQEVRVNGNVTVDVTADRSVEQQLRQRGLPDWVVDAVEQQLGRRIG